MAHQTDELIDLCLKIGDALDLRRRDDGPVISVEWAKFEDGTGGTSSPLPPSHDHKARDWPIKISDHLLLEAVHGHDVKRQIVDIYIHEATHAILQVVSPQHSGHGFPFAALDFSLRLRADTLNMQSGYPWWSKWAMQWCSPSLYDIQEMRGLGEAFEPSGIPPGDGLAWQRFGQRIGVAMKTGSELAESELSPRGIAVEAVLKWKRLIKPKAAPQPIMAPSLPRAAWNWLWYGSTLRD
jgi:hypothetical protein